MSIKLNIKDLKDVAQKLSIAIEKNKLNPKSGWIEIEYTDKLHMYVSNYDYFLQADLDVDNQSGENLHVTIQSDTFIPLISKLDADEVFLTEQQKSLLLTTNQSEYNFSLIKEINKAKKLDRIFVAYKDQTASLSGEKLSSIADKNAKGFLNSFFSNEIQQYIYLDYSGSITFTENIYLNNFEFNRKDIDDFKLLLTPTQAKLLKIFEDSDEVRINVEQSDYSSPIKVSFASDKIALNLICQSRELTDRFPSIRLRNLVGWENEITVDKKQLDRALARLMVFDKVFDIDVLNYSQLEFYQNKLKLVSIKNRNHEYIEYKNSKINTVSNYTAVIRFADLVNQLKTINSKDIAIGFGNNKAITLYGDILQLIPEIRLGGDG